MKIIQSRLLRGPNVYAWRPCLVAWIDSEGADPPLDTLALWAQWVQHWPKLKNAIAPQADAPAIALIPALICGLQNQLGCDVAFHTFRLSEQKPGVHRIVCEFEIEAVAAYALKAVVEWLHQVQQGSEGDIEAVSRHLHRLMSRHGLGPSTKAIVCAAQARDIPVVRLTEDASLFQLGWGRHQRRIQATMTDRTSHVAVAAASDKQMTKQLLSAVGIPVPKGRVVTTADGALEAVSALGRPVAIKPLGGNQGKGVTVGPETDAEVLKAFERAARFDRQVVVERAITGADHRALVVGQRLVAVAKRSPPSVLGDGTRTVRELVEQENQDPCRGEGHESRLTRIPLDGEMEDALHWQGLTLDDVPESGRCVQLRRNANLSTGGVAEDVTDLIHPDTAARCIQAACHIGLDIAGIDLVCEDIGLPLESQGGAILEVNAAPGIRMHEFPSQGQARPAGRAVVDMMFGSQPSHNGRIPIIAVTGTNGKTTTTLAIAQALTSRGISAGWATTEGVYVCGRQVLAGDCSGYWSARTLLSDPAVECAVLETARGGILKRGLAFDRCDVSVVLNVSADHIGQDGIDTVQDLAAVKRVVANAGSRAVVLNADDPLCVAMAEGLRFKPEVIYFSRDVANPVIRAHVERGGRAVVLHQQAVTVVTRAASWRLVEVSALPCTLSGLALHNVDNMLAAAAALMAIDTPAAAIAMGLKQFHSSASSNPLRMNFFRVGDVTVVVDYAHNDASYRALSQTLKQLFPSHRSMAVVSAPGDRRVDELKLLARTCAQGFDELIVYELDDLRGRAPGEVARTLLQGAWSAGIFNPTSEVRDVRDALVHALKHAGPRDVVVFACASHLDDLFEAATRLGVVAHELTSLDTGSHPWPTARHAG